MKNIASAQTKINPSAKPERFSIRSRVILDRRLSFRARLLFLYLDDIAWGQERFSIPQQAMKDALGMCIRHVKSALAELRKRRYISWDRHQRAAATYQFIRSKPSILEVHSAAPQEFLEVHSAAPQKRLEVHSAAPQSLLTQETKKQETPPLPPQAGGAACSLCSGYGLVTEVTRGIGSNRTCPACQGSGLSTGDESRYRLVRNHWQQRRGAARGAHA